MDSQLSILQTEKEDLISLMEEESTRQDKVWIHIYIPLGKVYYGRVRDGDSRLIMGGLKTN